MIKVANIIEDGRLGGPHVEMSEVAKRLYKHSIHTLVILPRHDSKNFQNKLKRDNVAYQTLTLHYLTREKAHLVKYLFSFFFELYALYRIIKKEKIDIVHISNSSSHYKGTIAGKLAGSKVLLHLNDTIRPKYIQFIFRIIAKFCSDGFIVAGNQVKQYYFNNFRMLNKPIYVIQAPVDCEKYNPLKLTREPDISNDKNIKIVTVANIAMVKGLEYFIEMAHYLNKEFDNLSFWIVGQKLTSQKKYYAKLENMVRKLKINNLLFYGHSNDIEKVLKVADIYVCSSISEASPMSVWEAMAMAMPIVSTDVGDVARFIKNNENGFVVPIKKARILAEKCASLLRDKDKAKKFGTKSREIAISKLDINICVKKHLDSYLDIYDK